MGRLVVSTLIILCSGIAAAQTLPPNFTRVAVGTSISNPTAMAFAPDGRIFVCEQGGALRVIKNNALLATPFISLTVDANGERGLLGIAFDPDFASNHYLYLYYTTPTNIHNRISRFTANGDIVVAGSEQIILELDALSSATNHNGGAIAFGKDGKLYVAIGENANGTYAQNLDIYHGKFLRINKDGSAPSDNPFFATGTEKGKRIWAYGLRNPYTFAIHPVSGRILLNDVGQVTYEEVNDATIGGKNFGWPTTEGNTTNPNFTSPVFFYGHTGGACAITGGTFFPQTNTNYPDVYRGKYFFQDLCSAWIYYFDPSVPGSTSTQFATNIGGQSLALTVGPDGNLYYLSRSSARLYKIVYTPPASAPVITGQPQPQTVVVGANVSFSVTVTGAAPLSYQWFKDGTSQVGKTESTITLTSVTQEHAGNYYVQVSNADGQMTSNNALLSVTAGPDLPNQLPVATIVKPVDAGMYRAGTSIAFEGTGTDTEDGTLAASAFSWAIHFHHDKHNHDQPAITGMKSGSFNVPNRGETSSNVWYRFVLTVTDSKGATAKDSVDVHPLASKLNFVTVPPGLQITLDGQPVTTPVSVTSVEGIERDLGIVDNQQVGEDVYTFSSWANTGTATQVISTPEDDVTYTATYAIVTGMREGRGFNVFYPNPASGWIFFSDPNIMSVTLINLLGQSASFQSDGAAIDVHNLSPGLYIMKLKTHDTTNWYPTPFMVMISTPGSPFR